MAQITDLPNEILIHIFKLYLELESQKVFHRIIPKVSKQFKEVSKSTLLWKKFDGTLPISFLLQLCNNGSLAQTEELIISPVKSLSYRDSCNKIFAAAPKLKAIDFSNVLILTKDVFSRIEMCGLKVSRLKFSSDLMFLNYNLSLSLIENFLKVQGKYLTVIDLSYTTISNARKLLTKIALSCPNLEQLLIHNVKHSTKMFFPLKVFQHNCVKLRVLSLNFLIHKPDFSQRLPGFPDLEVFVYKNFENWIFTDPYLFDVLSKSPNLKTLDLTGCECIHPNSLRRLPTSCIESFFIPMTRILEYECVSVFQKWSQSLRVLNLSRIKSNKLNFLLDNLASEMIMPNLEWLDVSETSISVETLTKMLLSYRKLTYLNLKSCRSIGRNKMKQYSGRNEVVKLYQCLTSQSDEFLPPFQSEKPALEKREWKLDGQVWKYECVGSLSMETE